MVVFALHTDNASAEEQWHRQLDAPSGVTAVWIYTSSHIQKKNINKFHLGERAIKRLEESKLRDNLC